MAQKTTAKDRVSPDMGKRLKQARESRSITQRDMAERLGITIQAYQNYEYGKEIASGRLIQICAILECSPNWLLGVKDTGMQLAPDSLLLKQLKEAFLKLNGEGQQEAVKRVQELGHVPAYVGEEKTGASASS